MLKFLLLWGNILELSFALTATETATKYCTTVNCVKGESVACKYTTNANMKCTGQLLKLNTTYTLNLHNSKRNSIALGNIDNFSAAVNMATIKWSAELEQMAKYNVMTCTFGHDKCRNTNTFPKSGQNLYMKSGTGMTTVVVDTFVKDAVNAWFIEYKKANMSLINNYQSWGSEAGHFTSMIKNVNNYVGCAINKYTSGGVIYVLMACNYQTTNVVGEPVYIAGTTASKCTNGRNALYTGLCA